MILQPDATEHYDKPGPAPSVGPGNKGDDMFGKKKNPQFNLGDRVRDRVTGVEGVVVAITNYLTGCTHVSIQQPQRDDGAVPDWHSVDVSLCDLVKHAAVEGNDDDTSGPQPPVAKPW